ncbi:29223_t:CDS:2, partial [Racocetra persica]
IGQQSGTNFFKIVICGPETIKAKVEPKTIKAKALNHLLNRNYSYFEVQKNIKLLETYCFSTSPDNVEEFLVKLQAQIRDLFAKHENAIIYNIEKRDTYQSGKKDLLTDEIDKWICGRP